MRADMIYLAKASNPGHIPGPEIDTVEFVSLIFPHFNLPSDFDIPAGRLLEL